MNTIAETIKQKVSMREAALHYGFFVNRAGFICCPFHNEDTPSLKLYPEDRGWYCFGCGAHGDIISFVQKLFSLDWKQAVVRINADFSLCLPIGQHYSPFQQKQAAINAAKSQRLREQERQKIEDNYWSAHDNLMRLVQQRDENKPTSETQEISPLYIEAVKNIEYAQYLFDIADSERSKRESK